MKMKKSLNKGRGREYEKTGWEDKQISKRNKKEQDKRERTESNRKWGIK